ncbi:MAG: stage II sporulation protein P [Bacilli bacterium]|nr:stage II sporulation protein P [Bacilli bacterium]
MKKFKTKKKYSLKIIWFILLIGIIYLGISYIKEVPTLSGDNKDIVSSLLTSINPHIENNNDISNRIFKYIFEIDTPFNVVEKEIYESSNVLFTKSITPKVYIYNTHDGEAYLENVAGVREAARLMKEKLDSVGIATLVEDNRVTPYLDTSYSTFYQAYAISRKYVINALEIYPDIELVIDLHRDAVERKYSYVTIDDVNYAKILFVQGVRYDTYKDNLELATNISDKLKAKYPGVSKGIMIKDKSYQHDSYNQDLNKGAILLELGSNNNTWEEINNTINILVPIIKEVLDEKESN